MKKIALSILFLNILVFSLFGDIIPQGHHVVHRKIIIENVDEFPDYTLLGVITGPMISGYEIREVKQGVGLFKGYKFNTYKMLAVHIEVIKASGGVDKLDVKSLLAAREAVSTINPGSYTIEDKNPLKSEEIILRIQGIEDGNLILYVSKRTLKFNDSRIPDKIENYSYKP